MKKILTLISLLATTSLMGQALISESDIALLEKLKVSSPFTPGGGTIGGVGSPQMLSLRGITKVGKFWYFSIYDASLNSSFWVQLKDGDRELSLIKANFFDDDNKELEISTESYTHILALKERDPLTGPVPGILGGSKSSYQSKGQQMGQMISSMNNEQKAAMAMHLAASMMGGRGNNMQGGNMQGQNNNNSKNSSGNNSKNSSSNKSSSNNSSRSSGGNSGGNSSGGRR